MTEPIHFDPQSIVKDDSYVEYLVDNARATYAIVVEGKTVFFEGRHLLINMVMLKPLIKRDLPIRHEHLILEPTFSAGIQKRVHSLVYRDIIASFGVAEQAQATKDMSDSINTLYNITAIYLGEHHLSIDAYSLAEMRAHPNLMDAFHVDLSMKPGARNIKAIEQKVQKASRRMMERLSDPKHDDYNVLAPFIKMNTLTPAQVSQVMLAIGTRTDVSDLMIHMPVKTGYAVGIENIREFAIDTLTAQKSLAYNQKNLRDTRYRDRLVQLMASAISTIHPGDCGAAAVIPFELTSQNHMRCYGKYYVNGNGKLAEITEKNSKSLIGKIVNLRSPLTCRHTDGTCHVCAGRMIEYILPDTVIGIASTIELMAKTAQLILSNKHFSTTAATAYELNPVFQEVLESSRNEVRFPSKKLCQSVSLGFPHRCVARLSDLKYVESGSAINDQHFSSIEQMAVMANKNKALIIPPMPTADDTGAVPYLSSEVLAYLKSNPEVVTISGDMCWIDFSKFDYEKPIMRCIVANASMIRFAQSIHNMLLYDISKYTSATLALKDVSNLFYQRLDPHLLHIEIVLKSAMVTSNKDARVPAVENPDNVKFRKLRDLIYARSISATFAYQSLTKWFERPSTYTVPKPIGPFDGLIGISQKQLDNVED